MTSEQFIKIRNLIEKEFSHAVTKHPKFCDHFIDESARTWAEAEMSIKARNNREKSRKQSRRYYWAHKEECNEASKKWRQENKEIYNALMRAYRKKQKEQKQATNP